MCRGAFSDTIEVYKWVIWRNKMNRKDFSDMGRDLRDIIKHSIRSADYDKITQDVGNTVNSALESAFVEVRKAINSIQMETQYNRQRNVNREVQRDNRDESRNDTRSGNNSNNGYKNMNINNTANMYHNAVFKTPQNGNYGPKSVPGTGITTFPHAPVGKVAGTLQTVFGSIGIGVMGTGVLVFGLLGISPTILAGLIILLSGSVLMEMNGSTLRNRVKRYKQYLKLLHGKTKCTIEELAMFSGFNEKFIAKDIKKMISVGMFPQAHVNKEKTLILLNRDSYNEYIQEQSDLKELQLLEQQKQKGSKKKKKAKEFVDVEPIQEPNVFDEGKGYIQQINAAKLAIVDSEVSAKVHRIEDTITRIIEYVEQHQEKLPEVRRFMQYYLPTVVKLLNAYHEFERQPIQGENITNAKREIKDALDSINQAFENLFDSLFQSASMNVSADISVLQTMLAQEGLTEQDFNTTKK